MNIPKSRNQIRKEEQKWLFLGCLLSCCLWRRGGGGAEATDVEALDAAGEGRLRLHHALQFHDSPLRARRLVAPAPHPDLHRCFSYLYLVGLVNGEWWIGDLLSKQRMRRGRRWNFSGCWRQRWGTKLPLSRPFFPLFLFSSRQNQKKKKGIDPIISFPALFFFCVAMAQAIGLKACHPDQNAVNLIRIPLWVLESFQLIKEDIQLKLLFLIIEHSITI